MPTAHLLPDVPRLFTLAAAAEFLLMTPDALKALLRRHPGLAEPRYSRLGRAPRLYRVLTTAEVQAIGAFLIASCLPTYPGRRTFDSPGGRGPQGQGPA